jgi:hypothetical protein
MSNSERTAVAIGPERETESPVVSEKTISTPSWRLRAAHLRSAGPGRQGRVYHHRRPSGPLKYTAEYRHTMFPYAGDGRESPLKYLSVLERRLPDYY